MTDPEKQNLSIILAHMKVWRILFHGLDRTAIDKDIACLSDIISRYAGTKGEE